MLTSVRAQNAQGRMGALAPLVLGQARLCGLLPAGIGLQLQDQLPELGSGTEDKLVPHWVANCTHRVLPILPRSWPRTPSWAGERNYTPVG